MTTFGGPSPNAFFPPLCPCPPADDVHPFPGEAARVEKDGRVRESERHRHRIHDSDRRAEEAVLGVLSQLRERLRERVEKQHGVKLDVNNGGELPRPLPVTVLGLPFEDFEHNRGSAQVATVWEIHPAIVTIQ